MEHKAYKALVASIEKWGKNALAEKPGDVVIGGSACPLCVAYSIPAMNRNESDTRCNGCPVKAKTGKNGCADTPYATAEMAHSEWQQAINISSRGGLVKRPLEEFRAAFRHAAHREYLFLIGLVPKVPPVEWKDAEPVKWEEAIKAAEQVTIPPAYEQPSKTEAARDWGYAVGEAVATPGQQLGTVISRWQGDGDTQMYAVACSGMVYVFTEHALRKR